MGVKEDMATLEERITKLEAQVASLLPVGRKAPKTWHCKKGDRVLVNTAVGERVGVVVSTDAGCLVVSWSESTGQSQVLDEDIVKVGV